MWLEWEWRRENRLCVCDMCAGVFVKKQGAIPVADHAD
jgi:hypothetical protein